ncbi:hypothetical protein AAF712_013128 [Marasmius tenuissimus]|uniref:Mannose-P-dolichol utilization defect 1 protein n=1 Tax=Marasmius tenuissimus TaxID=585030 RepID=A0ABR2ZGG7_9AGAR
MSAITKNLPWFVRDLGVSIVGEKCYTSLVENLNVGDVECIKYSISKGLGIGIVVGGSIMKVPQLMLSDCERPLSTRYFLAFVHPGNALVRDNPRLCVQKRIPVLDVRREPVLDDPKYRHHVLNHLLRAYQVALLFLSSASSKIAATAVGVLGTAGLLYSIDKDFLQILQLATLPLSLFSKLPQIRQNYRSKSTGQLSAFAVISQVAGCAARLFTIAQEVGDSVVAAGFLLALVLNLVLGVQVWMYWGQGVRVEEGKFREYASASPLSGEKDSNGGLKREYEAWQSQTQVQAPVPATAPGYGQGGIHHRVATPPPQGNRKWSRKVD